MSAPAKSEILQGTLDLMVLNTLASMGSLHGYGIARRIEQVSEQALQINQGTIYASLVRLQQRRLIKGEWGISENNRKARFYSVTKTGRKHLEAEAATKRKRFLHVAQDDCRLRAHRYLRGMATVRLPGPHPAGPHSQPRSVADAGQQGC